MQFSRTKVFITVDTETSIGGAFADPKNRPVGAGRRIYCRIGGKEYGIGLIMDMADRYGMKIVFFLEVFNKYHFGEGLSREVCETILSRGHEVQLHLHPNYLNFTSSDPTKKSFSDLIGTYPLARQVELLREARETLAAYGAPAPVAFRAGCFGADMNTLKALCQTGFIADSSYNAAYVGSSCLMPDLNINDVSPLNGVWEFPVTCFSERIYGLKSRKKPMDINGAGVAEMQYVLSADAASLPRCVTVVLHSFSFVKAYDVQYRRVRPRRHVIRRFERLLSFLKKNEERFEVMTYGKLTKEELETMSKAPSNSLTSVPPILSIYRGFWQLLDRII